MLTFRIPLLSLSCGVRSWDSREPRVVRLPQLTGWWQLPSGSLREEATGRGQCQLDSGWASRKTAPRVARKVFLTCHPDSLACNLGRIAFKLRRKIIIKEGKERKEKIKQQKMIYRQKNLSTMKCSPESLGLWTPRWGQRGGGAGRCPFQGSGVLRPEDSPGLSPRPHPQPPTLCPSNAWGEK